MDSYIITAIESELAYQKKKWPEEFHEHAPLEWIIILESLVQKAKSDWYNNGNKNMKDSLRKIAATAVAGMDQCGVSLRHNDTL